MRIPSTCCNSWHLFAQLEYLTIKFPSLFEKTKRKSDSELDLSCESTKIEIREQDSSGSEEKDKPRSRKWTRTQSKLYAGKMAAIQAALSRIGFTAVAALSITDTQGYDTLNEISVLTDDEVENLCRVVRRPGHNGKSKCCCGRSASSHSSPRDICILTCRE